MGVASPAKSTTVMPQRGSTAPERRPMRKARPFPRPARGRATAAPSGKFWSPTPRARAAAPARASPSEARAKARPTAIPSGMLCRVMAVIKRAPPWSPCRFSKRSSIAARKAAPAAVPTDAGPQPGRPRASARWIAGSSRLHTAAAVITPAAKPSIRRCQRLWPSPVRIKTVPAPRAVIMKVKSVPKDAQPIAPIIPIRLLMFNRIV